MMQMPPEIHLQIKRALLNLEGIQLAFIFGSVANNQANFNSDLDIAVLKSHPLTITDRKHMIETLAVITGRPIDLIDLSQAGEPILGQILKNGTMLIENKYALAELTSKHVFNQADFVPYQQRIYRTRSAKLIASI